MSDALKIALTALLGVAVFVVGQVIQRTFIEPIQELRRTIGRIAHALMFYANYVPLTPSAVGDAVVGKSADQMGRAKDDIRKLASELWSLPFIIPWYGLFHALGCVPSRASLEKASTNLRGWSNSLGGESAETHRKEIAAALELPIPGLYP
jgi:hypothetical protein